MIKKINIYITCKPGPNEDESCPEFKLRLSNLTEPARSNQFDDNR